VRSIDVDKARTRVLKQQKFKFDSLFKDDNESNDEDAEEETSEDETIDDVTDTEYIIL